MTRVTSKDTAVINLDMILADPVDDGSPIYGLWKEEIVVSIYLSSGIKLVGMIHWFDGETLTLRDGGDQSVFRNHIASILPPRGTYYSN